MKLVYVETTIPSYLAARPSSDSATLKNQQLIQEFWSKCRRNFHMFISEPVLVEISLGDPAAAARRLDFVRELEILPASGRVNKLVAIYEPELRIPRSARTDLVHIAYAVIGEMDYLLTLNCRHIANVRTTHKLKALNERLGLLTPELVTPEKLLSQGV